MKRASVAAPEADGEALEGPREEPALLLHSQHARSVREEEGAARSPSQGTAASRLIVGDDEVAAVHQLPRLVFLRRLESAVTRAADAELRHVGRTAEHCPFIRAWIDFFSRRPAAELERAIDRYASPRRRSTHGLLEAVSERTRIAARRFSSAASESERATVVRDEGRALAVSGGFRWLPPDLGRLDATQPVIGLGRGQPLPEPTRTAMERGFGTSFSRIRVHTGLAAEADAARRGARAYTVGDDVVFGHGAFRPGTFHGDALIAHELAHALQPAETRPADAEGDAHRRASLALLHRPQPPGRAAGGSRGLELRRCISDSGPFEAPITGEAHVVLAGTIARDLDRGRARAAEWLTSLRAASASDRQRALDLLRLRPHAERTNYYRWLLVELERGLSPTDWQEARTLVGVTSAALSARAQAVLDFLRGPGALPTMRGPTSDFASEALRQLRALPTDEASALLTTLHRLPDAQYGNGLFRLSARVRDGASPARYRDFVQFLHSAGLETVLDETDPRVTLRVEEESRRNREGLPSDLTDEQMAGLFATRALELAFTMLRDSERQLLRVMSRQDGGGAGPELDADAEAGIAALDRHFRPRVPPLRTFEAFSAAAREELRRQGVEANDEQLRRIYGRQRQLVLHRLAALRLQLARRRLREIREQIRDHEDWFRTMSVTPIRYNLIWGYAPDRMYRMNESRRRNAELRTLTSQERAYDTARRDVESAFPLLGGLDDEELARVAALTGGAAEFDELVQRAVTRVFSNIEEARRLLHVGEVSVWLLPPVVAATRRSLQIADTPANDTQRRWAAVIEQRRSAARAEAERVRSVLEVINAGLLVVALGASLFTGGGSLALYVGLTGLAVGLGTSVFDVVDASRRLDRAEVLYGSALTDENRLSEVPPDYRFLHLAWVMLGVNVVLSVVMLRSLGPQVLSALRGEDAAVRAQVRDIVRRLRAAGATQSEDELFEATMAALRERGFIAGGVRGPTYDVHPTRREWVTGAGRSLEQAIDALPGRPRLAGSTLARSPATAATGPTPGAPSLYELTVPTRSGGSTVVQVTFEARPASALPAGAHGAESGPARIVLTPGEGGRWSATVTVHEGVRPESLQFIVGHELDEISALVRRLPATATPAEIAAQMEARVFRPGSVTPGAALTAHDEAAMAELRALLDDLNSGTLNTAQRTTREVRLDRLLESMGLRDAEGLAERLAALRTAAIPNLDLVELEQVAVARGEFQRFMASTALSPEAASARGTVVIDEAFTRKTLFPDARSTDAFVQYGVRGGHVTGELQAFERANPQFAFAETSPATPRPGRAGFHRYDQYLWDPVASGSPTPPPVEVVNASGARVPNPLRPGGTSFNPAHWIRSTQVKTTADSLQRFLLEMENAFAQWRVANPGLATGGGTAWGRGLTPAGAVGGGAPALSNGIEFSGYFTYQPPTSAGSPPRWLIRSGFVDASWF